MEDYVVVVASAGQLSEIATCRRSVLPVQFDREFTQTKNKYLLSIPAFRYFVTYEVSNTTVEGCHNLSGIPLCAAIASSRQFSGINME